MCKSVTSDKLSQMRLTPKRPIVYDRWSIGTVKLFSTVIYVLIYDSDKKKEYMHIYMPEKRDRGEKCEG